MEQGVVKLSKATFSRNLLVEIFKLKFCVRRHIGSCHVSYLKLYTELEVASGEYLPCREATRYLSTASHRHWDEYF